MTCKTLSHYYASIVDKVIAFASSKLVAYLKIAWTAYTFINFFVCFLEKNRKKVAFFSRNAYCVQYCVCKGHRESWPGAVDRLIRSIVPFCLYLQLSLGHLIEAQWPYVNQNSYRSFKDPCPCPTIVITTNAKTER